jgi:hypothetical protein
MHLRFTARLSAWCITTVMGGRGGRGVPFRRASGLGSFAGKGDVMFRKLSLFVATLALACFIGLPVGTVNAAKKQAQDQQEQKDKKKKDKKTKDKKTKDKKKDKTTKDKKKDQ